jgi:putative ABC transport system permease protein
MADRLAAIAGVAQVSTRVTHNVVLDVPGMSEPVNGLLSSLPGPGDLNQLHVRRGRLLLPGSVSETVVSEPFAEAHGLAPGDRLWATVKGQRRVLTVVGVVLSPEYVFFGVPGAMVPDDRRFGVLWMDRDALEAAYDLKGAFNDVVLALTPHASEAQVIAQTDALLRAYGGVGAYGRRDHVSHATLSGEIGQLRASIRISAPIFIGVVAFLLHILMARHIATERERIGMMKALGYGAPALVWHYSKFVLAIVSLGVAAGLVGGVIGGRWITGFYAAHYRFPFLYYDAVSAVWLEAVAIQVAAGFLGALAGLTQVVRLAPAVAMRAPPPPVYRHTAAERLVMRLRADQPTRMILRHISRWPWRSGMTVLGIAGAVAILVAPLAVLGSARHMVDTHFFRAERQDLTVAFAQARSQASAFDIAHFPGVLQVQPFRTTPAMLRYGSRARRVTVIGLTGFNDLSRPLDRWLEPMAIPERGVILSSAMAKWLGVERGSGVQIDWLEIDRPPQALEVVGIAESYVGLTFFMVFADRALVNDALRESDAISGVHLRTDPVLAPALYAQLKDTPAVTGAVSHGASLAGMRRIVGENLGVTLINVAIAASIVFGVVFNSARIALTERGRELACMHLLGYSRWDLAYVLWGELGLLTAAAIPLGWGLGYAGAWLLTEGTANEMFRLPLYLEGRVLSVAALVVVAAVLLSAAAVARAVFRLDVIAVLKTKD